MTVIETAIALAQLIGGAALVFAVLCIAADGAQYLSKGHRLRRPRGIRRG